MPHRRPLDDGLIAAVDLGSNSFHLAVARLEHGQIRLLNTLSEKVQLAAGLDASNRLTADAEARALACLSRFAQHLQGVPPERRRVVATNALRVAKNAREFAAKAEAVLGLPVEIIAGREEARLIYVGVAQTLAGNSRRLVIDIGGGSTEFIIGEGAQSLITESLHMGCISYTQRFFADGRLSAEILERGILAARHEVMAIEQAYHETGWQQVIGSSGTIKAVLNVQTQMGLSCRDGHISRDGLRTMYKQLLRHSHVDDIDWPGLKEDRKVILPAGLVILLGIFEELGIEEMEFSEGALREGVLHDMVGRAQPDDIREHTISVMTARYQCDARQANLVINTANSFFNQLSSHCVFTDDDHDLLRWAAATHELGVAISHSSFHKHGLYVLRHSDMPGFSRNTQERLALLVGAHRRKIRTEMYHQILEAGGLTLLRLCVILRLSVLLHHSRHPEDFSFLALRMNELKFSIEAPKQWLASRPLIKDAFDTEKAALADIGLTLEWREI